MLPNPEEETLWTYSGINKEEKPFVQLIYKGEILSQFTTEEARQFALNVLACSEAAEMDTVIVRWLKFNKFAKSTEEAANKLAQFRAYRDLIRKK